MNELFNVLSSTNFDDYGSLFVSRVDLNSKNGELSLWLKITVDENRTLHSNWRIVCVNVLKHNVTLGQQYNISFVDEHPLLWHYKEPHASVSFYGKAENPASVVGALYQRHHEIAGKWISFKRYLNFDSYMSLEQLIAGGYGLLAEGPKSLLLPYEEVLKQHGISASHTEPQFSPKWTREETIYEETFYYELPDLSALIMNDSFVIATHFEAVAV